MPIDPADPASARKTAVTLLARRDYAIAELRGRLEKKGFDHTIVETTIRELVEQRALDDTRYSTNYVSYHAARGEGPVRIEADLSALGVPGELITAALASGPDWQVLARQVRLQRFGPGEPAEGAEKARQARFLQYRGFSSDHIRSAIRADFDLD
jgi:regulatory protein